MRGPLTGFRVRTLIDAVDQDPSDQRPIPAGTIGTLGELFQGAYDIAWINGAWSTWAPDRIARDSELA